MSAGTKSPVLVPSAFLMSEVTNEERLGHKDSSVVPRNESSWMFGPAPFVAYMNNEYCALQRNGTRRAEQLIVYQKKGTTGMAGQMAGVCDVLLLGVLHDRPVQSNATSSPSLSPTSHTTASCATPSVPSSRPPHPQISTPTAPTPR